jgi:hypothetical protein
MNDPGEAIRDIVGSYGRLDIEFPEALLTKETFGSVAAMQSVVSELAR